MPGEFCPWPATAQSYTGGLVERFLGKVHTAYRPLGLLLKVSLVCRNVST